MMEEQMQRKRLDELALMAFEGASGEERIRLLEEVLRSNSARIDEYIELALLYSILSRPDGLFDRSEVDGGTMTKGAADLRFWQALADYENTAPAAPVEKPSEMFVREPLRKFEKVQAASRINKVPLYCAIISTVALLFIMIMAKLDPVKPIVGYLSDSISTEWVVDGVSPKNGDALRESEMILVKGIAEITLEQGAVVTIESPAKIRLDGLNSIFLDSGKLSAKVSPYATGFTVRTPSCSVIDLGTEFAISTEGNGSSSVYMFDGKANLVAGATGEALESELLFVEQARRVEAGTSVIRDIPFHGGSFVRKIDSKTSFIWNGGNLDLADVVGGGNGFGNGIIDQIIDLETGMISDRHYDGDRDRPAPGRCIEVPSLLFVDCLFVPDGGAGVDGVSLSGIRFENCPDTNGRSFGDISNGGIIRHDPVHSSELVLDGITYGTRERPAIFIHGNQGITFDLEAIRKTLPGVEITGFQSRCGISQTVTSGPNYRGDEPHTSFWVLVDGKPRFAREKVRLSDPASTISVGLSEEDRYLSLVVTDGDGNHKFDWGVFALPELQLRSQLK